MLFLEHGVNRSDVSRSDWVQWYDSPGGLKVARSNDEARKL